MIRCVARDDALALQCGHEWLLLQPWGEHGLRLRIGRGAGLQHPDWPSALLPPAASHWQWGHSDGGVWLSCGRLRLEVSASGQLALHDLQRQFCLWQELAPRRYRGDELAELALTLAPHDDEYFYGLGQHPSGHFNLKGQVVDLRQHNGQVAVPFLVSSRGYGLLWNLPACGRVELATNRSRWLADAAPHFDLWLTAAATPAEILSLYHRATGLAPMIPDWALGFWQSKLRYASQAELLWVAAEYRRRELPLAVMVVDYFHWPQMGAYCFDERDWPDAAAMCRTLHEWGIAVVVSTWPTINRNSPAYTSLTHLGALVQGAGGQTLVTDFMDSGSEQRLGLALYDPSLAAARHWMAEQCERGYLSQGVDGLWLDACEPEISLDDPASWRLAAGRGDAVGLAYPFWHQQAFAEHQPRPPLLLCRSAWAGSQRFGAAVWSGDIASTFASLKAQIAAGLNMAMAGIGWWTTDIGGFYGGHGDDPAFHELLSRWFQYALFCPLMRLHGKREPGNDQMGAANEIWSFGAVMERRLSRLVRLREALRPYLHQVFAEYAATGMPPMRPLLLMFPADGPSWLVADQFLCGPDLLVWPLTEAGVNERQVWLPSGCRWWQPDGERWLEGGQWLTLHASLDQLPVVVREGSPLLAAPWWLG